MVERIGVLGVMYQLLFIIIVCFAYASADNTPGCTPTDVLDDNDYASISKKLSAEPNEIVRQRMMLQFLGSGIHVGFSSDQVLGFLALFKNEITRGQILEAMGPFVTGLSCQEVVKFLSTFTNVFSKIDALKVVVNITNDLRVANQSIVQAFTGVFNQRDAQEIINNARVRSCVWGDVQSVKRAIFIVDCSGSMSTAMTAPDGSSTTRMDFVKAQLRSSIANDLAWSQQFNVIRFASGASAWEPGVVSVTPETISQAVQYVDGLAASGSTNMLAAIRLAFADPNASGVFILSDGEPDSGQAQTILTEAARWAGDSKTINTIAFYAGGKPDANAVKFMQQLAASSKNGIFRWLK